MWSARQIGVILAYAAIPLLLVVGSVALAVTEGAPAPEPTPAVTGSPAPTTGRPAPTETAKPTNTASPSSTMADTTPTTKPSASATASPTESPPTSSPTLVAEPTGAPADDVDATATAAVLSPPVAAEANSCGPFPGWSKTYVVRPGDTLFRIAVRYRTSVWELRQANCKESVAVVHGERLWVPVAGTSHWEHRSLPAFRWHRWQQSPWVGGPEFAPEP